MSKEIPDLPGFEEHYGIRICTIGEDGDLVALGHWDLRHALAAFNSYARRVIGLTDLLEGDGGPLPDDDSEPLSQEWKGALGRIDVTWARLMTECDEADEEEHEDDCYECSDIKEHVTSGSWWLSCDGRPDSPNTFPVMHYPA